MLPVPKKSNRQRVLLFVALATAPTLLVGCGGTDMPVLNDYLEEIEYNTPMEAFQEVSVGNFKVSAATLAHEDSQGSSNRTWVQTRCKLYVVVDPKDEKGLQSAYERHRGMFDDMIVRILRGATIDELSDPRWATIKTRITDAARSILGKDRIRQVVFYDCGWEPI